MQSIIRASGKIDLVISAAAIVNEVAPPSAIPASELSEILQTNTVGLFLVISLILHERAIRGWEHKVKVVHVSSALSHTHICRLSAYAASKAAMNLLCLHLHMEWNARGVSVFAIHPGVIFTRLTGKIFTKDPPPLYEDGKFFFLLHVSLKFSPLFLFPFSFLFSVSPILGGIPQVYQASK